MASAKTKQSIDSATTEAAGTAQVEPFQTGAVMPRTRKGPIISDLSVGTSSHQQISLPHIGHVAGPQDDSVVFGVHAS